MKPGNKHKHIMTSWTGGKKAVPATASPIHLEGLVFLLVEFIDDVLDFLFVIFDHLSQRHKEDNQE